MSKIAVQWESNLNYFIPKEHITRVHFCLNKVSLYIKVTIVHWSFKQRLLFILDVPVLFLLQRESLQERICHCKSSRQRICNSASARRKEIDPNILLLAFKGPQARGEIHAPRFDSYFYVHLNSGNPTWQMKQKRLFLYWYP
mgnify:CR=1 FL=1